MWQAWLVTASAGIAVLLFAAYLEAAVRQDIRDTIKVEPAAWSDPQVRAYATARSRPSFAIRPRSLRQVVQMRPNGAITAAAASELTAFGPEQDEIKYALVAARAAPADSPMFAVYSRMAARELEQEKREPEAIALLRESLERAALPKGRSTILSSLLHLTADAEGLRAVLRAYAEYERRRPDVAHADHVQETLAGLLEDGRRQADAERIYRHLAAHAASEHIRDRARQKLAEGGADGD